jgi:hypothetical protein
MTSKSELFISSRSIDTGGAMGAGTIFNVLGLILVCLIAALGCCPSLFSLPFLFFLRREWKPRQDLYFHNAVFLHLVAMGLLAGFIYLLLSADSPGGLGSMAFPLYIICTIFCWVLHGAAKSNEKLAYQAPRNNV